MGKMKPETHVIEKRIRDLVPRLNELSFGCELISMLGSCDANGKENFSIYIISAIEGMNSKEPWYHCRLKNGSGYISAIFKKIENTDIIGHPITLEDVLEAFHSIKNPIECWDYPANTYHIYEKWEPGKKFNEQSEETQLFIWELINEI